MNWAEAFTAISIVILVVLLYGIIITEKWPWEK